MMKLTIIQMVSWGKTTKKNKTKQNKAEFMTKIENEWRFRKTFAQKRKKNKTEQVDWNSWKTTF